MKKLFVLFILITFYGCKNDVSDITNKNNLNQDNATYFIAKIIDCGFPENSICNTPTIAIKDTAGIASLLGNDWYKEADRGAISDGFLCYAVGFPDNLIKIGNLLKIKIRTITYEERSKIKCIPTFDKPEPFIFVTESKIAE